MPDYIYKVKDETGRTLYGIIQANDKKEIKRKLRDPGLYFVGSQLYNVAKLKRVNVSSDDLLMFTHRLYSLIDSGIPILSALTILWKQTENHEMQLVISQIRSKLEEGTNLTEALQDFPEIFSPLYRSLVSVGETGAGFVQILKKLSQYLDQQRQFVMRTKRVVLYPAFVLGFALIVMMLMFIVVVPTFQKVLAKINVQLPFLTQIIIQVSTMMRTAYFPMAIAGIIFLVWFFNKRLSRVNNVAVQLDRIKLKLPVFGEIYYTIAVSRFIRSLSLLVGAGIPILQSFDVAQTTIGNRKISDAVDHIKSQVTQGSSLYSSFINVRMFPVMVTEMIGIGETAGNLPNSLERLANHFDEQVDYLLNKFLTILEPMLIILVGGIVCIILLGIYMPIFTLWKGFTN